MLVCAACVAKEGRWIEGKVLHGELTHMHVVVAVVYLVVVPALNLLERKCLARPTTLLDSRLARPAATTSCPLHYYWDSLL